MMVSVVLKCITETIIVLLHIIRLKQFVCRQRLEYGGILNQIEYSEEYL